MTDAPTEPLPPAGAATRQYETIEEEGPPPVPPGPPRRAWYEEVGWALLALLLLVIAGLAIWWFGFHNRSESKRTVPVVTGMHVAGAVNTLQNRGFKVRIVSHPHPEPRGTVYQEIPPAGSRAAKGSIVHVLTSTGPAAVTVPNAVGLAEAAGRDRLVAAGFTVTESRVFSQEPSGTIIAQSPTAGSNAAKGTAVRVNVSKGTGVVIVPNVVGSSVGDAETKLAKAGLKPVVQLHVPSAQPVGTVVAQQPPGGQAKRGSEVRLNVSTGSGAGTTGPTGAGGPTGTTGASGPTG